LDAPLSGECGTCKTVKACFWPGLAGTSPWHLARCPLFAADLGAWGERKGRDLAEDDVLAVEPGCGDSPRALGIGLL